MTDKRADLRSAERAKRKSAIMNEQYGSGVERCMSLPSAETAKFKHWTVGSARITRFVELQLVQPADVWLEVSDEQKNSLDWLRPDFATEDGELRFNVQSFVIEIAGKRIVVDPGVGNGKLRNYPIYDRLRGPFLENLSEVGFGPETIDFVINTHLHIDHCGWNTRLLDEHWVPTFPNARYLFGRVEFEYAKSAKDYDVDLAYLDSVKPIIDAGQAELAETNHQVVEGVHFEPSPGHTPGHLSVVISSDDAQAVIVGDLIHHPIQARYPDLCSQFCWDKTEAARSRRSLLERCAGTDTLLLGAHFAGPTA